MTEIAPTVENVELMKDEGGGLMMESGISTLSFYKGDSTGFQKATTSLREQFVKVVGANPWLAGRLVTNKDKGCVNLSYPAEPSNDDIDTLFSISDEKKYTSSMPYVDTCNALYKEDKFMVADGYSLLNKDKPVSLLTLIESSPNEFALIFSMSHQIGDGRTYYEVYKMLQPGTEVKSLTVNRIYTFSEDMRELYGKKELAWAESTSTELLFTFSMMCNSAAKCFAFYLDDEKVKAAKAEAVMDDAGVAYVTTNDIITSGFFNVTNARIGMMGYDCRDKMDGIDGPLAGNYVTALVLDPEVFSTPATLRNMYVPKGQPHITTKRALPSFPNCCGGNGNFAMVTNWSSFATSLVEFDGCEIDIHIPVQNPAYCVYDLMIPFACGKGKKGLLIWTVSTDEAGLKDALPVGASVSDKLFPQPA